MAKKEISIEDQALIANHKLRLQNKVHERYDLKTDININFIGINSFTEYVLDYMDFIKTEDIPTIAVGFDKINKLFILFYNPKFMCQLTMTQKYIVLTHEVYHICLEHLTTLNLISKNPDNKNEREILNIAGDLVINGQPELMNKKIMDFKWIDSDTFEVCKPIIPGYYQFRYYYPKQTLQQYYSQLKRDLSHLEKNQNYNYKIQTLDSHDKWDDIEKGDIEEIEAAKEDIKEIMDKIYDKIIENKDKNLDQEFTIGYGNLPSDIKKQIKQRQNSYQINPRQFLNKFLKNSVLKDIKRSFLKVNRRKPYISKGRKKDIKPKLLVFVDHSGSVSDKLLSFFNGWLDDILKYVEVTVIPFDTQVKEKDKIVYKQGQKVRKERYWCGGTNFQAPTDWANQRKYDGVAIVTDLMAPMPTPSKHPRVWVTNQEWYSYFGKQFEAKGEKVINLGKLQ